MTGWDAGEPGVVVLPSGRTVRGRALSRPLPAGPEPTFGLYLLGSAPPAVPWASRWLRWPDFRLPVDPADARAALEVALARAGRGGPGRTGTARACLAILDGMPPEEAVAWVRAHYARRAVETRAQARFVLSFL